MEKPQLPLSVIENLMKPWMNHSLYVISTHTMANNCALCIFLIFYLVICLYFVVVHKHGTEAHTPLEMIVELVWKTGTHFRVIYTKSLACFPFPVTCIEFTNLIST